MPLGAKITAFSKGIRIKLALLLVCCRGADLLVLDEPTDGLDPASTEAVLVALMGVAATEGTTMLISSHHIKEIERVAGLASEPGVVRADRSGRVITLLADLELVRLAFPRRVYTQSHTDYVAEVLVHLNTMAKDIRGVRIVEQPLALRHFTAKFEPLPG